MATWFCSPTAPTWVAPEVSAEALQFHRSLPEYEPTPLMALPDLATELGVGRVLVKDESSRLGLPAFKVLGASWACNQVIDQNPGARLVTATDGNHGRAVARMAAHLGVEATVFVPRGDAPGDRQPDRSEGAYVSGSTETSTRQYAERGPCRRAPGGPWCRTPHGTATTRSPPGTSGYQTFLQEVDAELEALGAAGPSGGAGGRRLTGRGSRSPLPTAAVPHPSILSVEPDTAPASSGT